MTHMKTILMAVAVASALTVPTVLAQQPQPQHDDKPPASAMKPGMPAGGMDAHMAHHMEMCRQIMAPNNMMGAGIGPGMMGGMISPGIMDSMMMSVDPKERAELMAMRGEMMKAIGDVMLKYAQRAQSKR